MRRSRARSYFGPRQQATRAALAAFERAVPEARNPRLRTLISALPDTGMRAAVEAAICERAAVLLYTAAECVDCRRARRCSKMSSAFGLHLRLRRAAYARPSSPLF